MKSKITNVLLLFLVETVVQILYYSFSIKYMDQFFKYDRLGDILFDTFYSVGGVKVIFFLPIYFLFYFLSGNKFTTPLRASFYHSILFLLLFFIVSIMLPGDAVKRIFDTFFLTLIAFLTSLLIFKTKNKLAKISR